jgi:hypothetical protein
MGKFLGDHMIPVVIGPKKRQYIIDHHHLALALHYEGLEHVLVTVVADLSPLELDSFWVVLDHHGWVHPYDASGQRQGFGDIPELVARLQDDPFRSLAGGSSKRFGAMFVVPRFSRTMRGPICSNAICHGLLGLYP